MLRRIMIGWPRSPSSAPRLLPAQPTLVVLAAAVPRRSGFGAEVFRPEVRRRWFRTGFVGPGRFGFRPAFGVRPGFGPRFGFRNRFFFRNRFAFAAVPFGVGLGYGASCWSWVPTAWGWQRAWVCGNDYGYGYCGWGYGGWGY
jgi:hypothetical protein